MNKKLEKLHHRILVSYWDKKYEQVIELFEIYTKIPHVAIDEYLLNLYCCSLEKIGSYEKALENYKVYDSFYRSIYTKIKLSKMYLNLKKYEEAILISKQCLQMFPNNLECHYVLGRIYLVLNQIDNAKKEFEICLQSNDKKILEKTKRNLLEIERYEKNGSFIEMDYEIFKNKGYKLDKGHIVYLNKEVKLINTNQINGDKKSKTRPYFIWKLENEVIYCFPLSTKIKPGKDIVLNTKDYPFFSIPVTAKNNLCCIDASYIYRVVGKINEKDYYSLLENIFYSTYYEHEEEAKEGKKQFLKEMEHVFLNK